MAESARIRAVAQEALVMAMLDHGSKLAQTLSQTSMYIAAARYCYVTKRLVKTIEWSVARTESETTHRMDFAAAVAIYVDSPNETLWPRSSPVAEFQARAMQIWQLVV